ncbi:MAG: antitoxin [Candidatus Moranbacteria bacterium]|nr:antitoxin [Candidatus Moranbacteria bacterium]
MKYSKLDQEEKNILKDFNQKDYTQVQNFNNEKKRFQSIAKSTLQKTRHINIRLTERDLQKIKIKAIEKGIPYQTLVSSVIHQYADNRMKIEI